jgi:ubiquinone/menaquinone biosynthesis C-methylase UbiE
MNWKHFWQQIGTQQNPLLQVGRKVGEVVQDEHVLEAYAAYIALTLELSQNDVLLDVCCGNGLLTSYLAKHCKAILGVDFSQTHIDYANIHFASSTVTFQCVDALMLEKKTLNGESFSSGFTKSTLCFSFQYFESEQLGLQVVRGIFKQGVKRLFITDIPDSEHFLVYYHSFLKLARLLKQNLFKQNDMGKFWSEKELLYIAKSLGLKGNKILQPAYFPYSAYRSDFIFKVMD